jgi:CheY-like chemotaxis protein
MSMHNTVSASTAKMDRNPEESHTCPYCGRPLQWVSERWFGRGTYECETCGDFPDLTTPLDRQADRGRVGSRIGMPARQLQEYGRRPNILLVDDSPEYRDLYAVLLEQTATVITASRGEDALAIAAAQPLDAIVLDVMMPGMDGWQTCERLKANPQTRSIPVIMLTSLDGLDVPETAARVGAAYVLIKPCPVERLALAIKSAVHDTAR